MEPGEEYDPDLLLCEDCGSNSPTVRAVFDTERDKYRELCRVCCPND